MKRWWLPIDTRVDSHAKILGYGSICMIRSIMFITIKFHFPLF